MSISFTNECSLTPRPPQISFYYNTGMPNSLRFIYDLPTLLLGNRRKIWQIHAGFLIKNVLKSPFTQDWKGGMELKRLFKEGIEEEICPRWC